MHSGESHLKIENLNQFRSAEPIDNPSVSKNKGSQEKSIDAPTFEDDEDITRKLVSLARYFAVVCWVFVLSYACSISLKRFPFHPLFPLSSRKYILQRVLRI